MDILKRWLKLKKAQRVRNPWALATALNQGGAQGRGNSGTSKGAYKAGIDRNEWNSPDGLDDAAERSAQYHGYGTKRKEGFEYTGVASGKKENNNAAISDDDKKGVYNKDSRNWNHEKQKKKGKGTSTTSKGKGTKGKGTKGKGTSTTSKKGKGTKGKGSSTKPKTEGVFSDIKIAGTNRDNIAEIYKDIKDEIKKLGSASRATPNTAAKRKQKTNDLIKIKDQTNQDLESAKGEVQFDPSAKNIKAFKDLAGKIKTAADKYNSDFPIQKSSTSRRLLNILKESVTVDNDQLEKDFTSALYQAMKKHKEDFGVPTGNNEILKGVKNKQKPEEVKKIMDLPNFTKVKNAPQVKKGITDSLLAMLAGYKLTPKVNPGEMTPAQQRQWERTLQNQMRRKNIDIDKAAFKQLQNFYKDKSDTYTRRKPAKNGVKVEKILTSPPFQGAEFDPVSHRWKKPGEVAAQTGNVNVGTGGKRRVRGAGTGAAQRSVGGHARGIRRAERLGVAARGKAKGKSASAKRSARIKAFKTLTRKR